MPAGNRLHRNSVASRSGVSNSGQIFTI